MTAQTFTVFCGPAADTEELPSAFSAGAGTGCHDAVIYRQKPFTGFFIGPYCVIAGTFEFRAQDGWVIDHLVAVQQDRIGQIFSCAVQRGDVIACIVIRVFHQADTRVFFFQYFKFFFQISGDDSDIFDAVGMQCLNDGIDHASAVDGNQRLRRFQGYRTHALADAGLVYRLEKVENPQIPLSAYSDASSFKVYMNDVGILRRNSGIAYQTILTEPKQFHNVKGTFAENYCMTEMISLNLKPYYWKNGNSAEVDFLFEDEMNRIIPLETKSADNTRAKSFHLFCKQYSPAKAFLVSTKNIGDNLKDQTHEINLPLYLMWNLKRYIQSIH